MTSLYPCSNQLARYYGRRLRLHATTLVSRKNSDNAKRGKSDVTYPCPCTLTFLHLLPPTSPLSLFERWRRNSLHHRTYIHAHTYTIRGTKEAGGEFDRRIFNAIKNKPLPSRACLIFSRAWIATRRDATRRVALSNGNKLRISRRGEIFIARSVH